MNRPNDLFDLIASMTRGEKRYFKLYAPSQSGQKNYLRLFDAIARQRRYDEDAIRKTFAGEAFTRQLHVAKNYLYRSILRSLRAYHAESTIDAQIHSLLQDARILFQKGLARQCAETLRRARSLAEEYEREYALLEILDMEDRYLADSNITREALDASHAERRELLKKIENAGEMGYLAGRATLVMYRGIPRDPEAIAEIEELLHHPLLADEHAPRSTDARRSFNHIRATCHYSRNETAKAIAYTELNARLLENRFEYAPDHANAYVGVLTNLAILYSDAGEEARFHDLLSTLRSLPEMLAGQGYVDERLLYRIFNFSTGIEMLHYNARGEFDRAIAMIPGIEEGRIRFRRYLSPIDGIRFDYLIAWALFGIGRHKDALDAINNVLEHTDLQARQHLLCSAKLLNLLIHYELGNMLHIDSLVRSTYRYLRRRKNLFRFESILLHHFRAIPGLRSAPDLRAWFGLLLRELEPLAESRFERQAFAHFNYIPWLRSKVEGKSFTAMARAAAECADRPASGEEIPSTI